MLRKKTDIVAISGEIRVYFSMFIFLGFLLQLMGDIKFGVKKRKKGGRMCLNYNKIQATR